MLTVSSLLDLNHTRAAAYFARCVYPWELLPQIKTIIPELGKTLGEDFTEISPQVWVHKTAIIAPTAHISAPCIIGAGTEVRHCAFIRGNALVGDGCVVGNSVELKNVILFDGVQVPHFNYVGDSILGHHAHMGAGSVTSNVKADRTPVVVHSDPEIPTNLKKFGAILGDGAEIGCNSALNPGCVVGRNSSVYPVSCVRGVVPENSIYKDKGNIVEKN